MDFIYYLLAISFLCFIFILRIYINDYYNPLNSLPGDPMKNPIFGVITNCLSPDFDIVTAAMREFKRFGPVRKVHLFFGEIRIEVSDVDSVQHILVRNAKNYRRGKFAGVEVIREVLGDTSIILSSGKTHKRHRKIVTQALKPSIIRQFVPTYASCTNRLIDKLNGKLASCDSYLISDVKQTVSDLTLDIIGLIAFGIDYHAVENHSEFVHAIQEISTPTIRLAGILPFYSQLCKFLHFVSIRPWLGLDSFSFFYNLRKLHEMVDREVRERKFLLESGGVQRQNLLDMVVEFNKNGELSDEEVRSVLNSIAGAGHETAAVSLSFTLMTLAQHQEIQQKCHVEAKKILGSKLFEEITADDVQKLSYISCVLNETLRLYPPAPFIDRCAIESDTIGGYPIPAGTDILIQTIVLHRNPEIWGEDSAEFKPERFANPDNIPHLAFMPFGDGAHKCVGFQLALMELPLILALLLKEFKFSMVPGMQYRTMPGITISMKPKLQLFIEKAT